MALDDLCHALVATRLPDQCRAEQRVQQPNLERGVIVVQQALGLYWSSHGTLHQSNRNPLEPDVRAQQFAAIVQQRSPHQHSAGCRVQLEQLLSNPDGVFAIPDIHADVNAVLGLWQPPSSPSIVGPR